MRLSTGVLLACAVAASTADAKRITAFKKGKTVSESETGVEVFSYKGFPDGTGLLKMRVSNTPSRLSDEEWADLKGKTWYPTQKGSMLKAGYDQWRVTPTGLRFKNKEGITLECANGDSRHELVFDCEHANETAMLQTREKAPEYSASDTYEYDDNQKGELWIPADHGVPYGWNKLAASFGFPYFTVTPKGYLGCYKLDHGMCSMTPDRFQTTGFQPNVAQPQTSIERTDSQPQRLTSSNDMDIGDLRLDPSEITNDAPLPE